MSNDNLPAHPSCKDCRAFYRKANYGPPGVNFGECRRDPPTIEGWPTVAGGDWCCAFLPFEDDTRTFVRLRPTEEKP